MSEDHLGSILVPLLSATGQDVEALFVENGKKIAEKIVRKETTLLLLVEGLSAQLTSTNVHDRVKAVDILGNVLTALPPSFLEPKELEFIVEFLCNRLKDQHLVVPKAILCILPVIQCQNLPRGTGSQLLHQMFQEVNVQSHVQKIRRSVFLIIEHLLRNRLEELKEMSSDFIINFLQAIDGEKDPRNLLLLFQMIPCVMSNFNLGPFVEEFFEVLSCYFPIDFTPNIGGFKSGILITREMLASALHTCLSHTNQFSPFLIPLALEKLDSSLHDAKIDSLQLLELCCDRCYLPENLQPFLPQLWRTLRKEIFMGGNESVENHCIRFLQSAFKVVSEDEGTLKTCIDLIFTECKHHLCEPELRLIHPTSKILLAMCNSCEKSCQSVAPKVLQVLVDQLVKSCVQGERKRIMEITEKILAASRQYPQVEFRNLLKTWDEMLTTWFSFITNDDTDFSNLSLRILLQAMKNEADFSEKERFLLQEHLLCLVKSNSLSSTALATSVEISVALVSRHGEEFSKVSVPTLLNCVCDNGKNHLSVQLLSESSPCNEQVCEQVVSALLSKLSFSSISRFPEPLVCLNRIIGKIPDMNRKEEVSVLSQLLAEKQFTFDKIFDFTFQFAKTQSETEKSHEYVYECGTNILRNLMRICDENIQQKLVNRFWKQRVAEEPWESCMMAEFPFPLVEAILGPLRPSVEVHRKFPFCDYLLHQGLQRGTKSSFSQPYHRLLSVMLNKIDSEVEFVKLLNNIESVIQDRVKLNVSSSSTMEDELDGSSATEVHCTEVEATEAEHATSLLAWITKGLAMRGMKDIGNWVQMMIDLLDNKALGMRAASGFDILLFDDEVSLNPQSHCKYRFLYKQRIFQMSVPRLVENYRKSKSNTAKANFIKALSSQLKYIPKEILALEMESVFPLLVASLKLDTSASIALSTLKAFIEMLQNSDDEIDKKLVEYVYDIVPKLVALSGFQGNLEVRILALKCLQICAKVPVHVILPLRSQVVSGLAKCVDDHKRVVRQEARLTRSIWILIGSPGGI